MKKMFASALLLMSGVSANATLVTNGDFETGDLTGWSTTGFLQEYVTTYDGSYVFVSYSPYPDFGTLSQTIDTVIGETYQIDIQVKTDYAYPGHNFFISVDGDQISENISSPYTFTQISATFVATGVESVLEFNFANQEAGGGWYADNISASLAPVPVPAAAWLFGSGIVCLFGVARRKLL